MAPPAPLLPPFFLQTKSALKEQMLEDEPPAWDPQDGAGSAKSRSTSAGSSPQPSSASTGDVSPGVEFGVLGLGLSLGSAWDVPGAAVKWTGCDLFNGFLQHAVDEPRLPLPPGLESACTFASGAERLLMPPGLSIGTGSAPPGLGNAFKELSQGLGGPPGLAESPRHSLGALAASVGMAALPSEFGDEQLAMPTLKAIPPPPGSAPRLERPVLSYVPPPPTFAPPPICAPPPASPRVLFPPPAHTPTAVAVEAIAQGLIDGLPSAPPPVYVPGALAFEAVAQSLIDGPPAMPAVGSPELPTMGSAGHMLGNCKPCAFFHTKGCGNGVACVFCHLCDATEKKRRKKEKRSIYLAVKTYHGA